MVGSRRSTFAMARFSFTSTRGGSSSSGRPVSGKPVTGRQSPFQNAGCLVGFFAVFLLAGLGFGAFFAVPAWHVFQARAWTPVPCEILESHVETHPGDDNDTYSIEVRYRYEVAGRSYTSDRYTFLGGSSSGRESKQRVVDSLPAGARTTCWVDPEDPSQAALKRGFTLEYLFILLPLIFVAVGAGGIVFSVAGMRRKRRGAAAGKAAWLPETEGVSPATGAPAGGGGFREIAEPAPSAGAAGAKGPLVLEPSAGPVGKLVGILFLALVWNGIVSVFVYQVWQSWKQGAPDGCLTLFLVPFVLVGLALIVGVPYQFLALFNPRPRLTLTPGRLTLGQASELAWRFSGRAGRIRRLTITLEGHEEAVYRRGTDTVTAKETFATLPVAEVSEAVGIATGSARIEMPADTMHSFQASHNRIVWTLKVRGDIRSWPDVSEGLKVVVAPPAAGSAWSAPADEGIWS